MRFVAEHADRRTVDGLRWGVEPICRVLTEHGTPIAPSTFYDARTRRSDRAVRDEQLKAEISRIWNANYGVYGARKMWKMWKVLHRSGHPVGRCRVERLMRTAGPGRRRPRPAQADHDPGQGRGPGR